MGQIKALQTVYKGYKFRSRLEARWAVFFDTAGIKYMYEPEGFEYLPEGSRNEKVYYLPDFWLSSSKIYVEVKPTSDLSDEAIEKAKALAHSDDARLVIIVCGEPQTVLYEDGMIYLFYKNTDMGEIEGERWPGDYLHVILFSATFVKLVSELVSESNRILETQLPSPDLFDKSLSLATAVNTYKEIVAHAALEARSARFETKDRTNTHDLNQTAPQTKLPHPPTPVNSKNNLSLPPSIGNEQSSLPPSILPTPSYSNEEFERSIPPYLVSPDDDALDDPTKILTIILRSSGDKTRDILRLRRIHGIFMSYPGKNHFAFHWFGKTHSFLAEFPSSTTGICQDLIDRLSPLVGPNNIIQESYSLENNNLDRRSVESFVDFEKFLEM